VADAERERLRVVRESFADRPAYGAAVSRAILERVAAGELAPTVRLHRTGRALAFGRQDAASDRFDAAVAAARDVGFEPIVRLAGGRAALYHEGTIALSWVTPDPNPTSGTHSRFEELSELVAAAVRRLGVDARVGEVPGEYCPGAYSVNARGRSKLVGIGQRIISGGAHLGVVIVVRGSVLVRETLIPVYDALGLEWDPDSLPFDRARPRRPHLFQVRSRRGVALVWNGPERGSPMNRPARGLRRVPGGLSDPELGPCRAARLSGAVD
jgi:octanoyl-[GcvH]:protein N-octanoyltransferase